MDQNSATRCDCCCRLSRDHCAGEIPERDQGGDANGFTPKLDLGGVQMGRDPFDVGSTCFFGVELDKGRGIVDFTARLRDRLALLGRHDLRQVLAVFHDQVMPLAQYFRALLRQRLGPRRECLLGNVDCLRAICTLKCSGAS